jgi:hypothetical protein
MSFDAPAGLICARIIPTNYNFGLPAVFSLAIAICIKVSSVLKFLQAASIFIVMSSLMSLFFPFHLSIPQRELAIIPISFLTHPQPQGITLLLM